MAGNPQANRLLCTWPGLARLWVRGDAVALAWAVGFGALLNLAVLATFVWPELVGSHFRMAVWPVVLAWWGIAACRTWRTVPLICGGQAQEEDDSDGLFRQAQREYLRRNWAQVETLLARRLRRYPRDATCRLLLSTMYRRMGQLRKATDQLSILQRIDPAIAWSAEIDRELRLVAETAGNASKGAGRTPDSVPLADHPGAAGTGTDDSAEAKRDSAEAKRSAA